MRTLTNFQVQFYILFLIYMSRVLEFVWLCSLRVTNPASWLPEILINDLTNWFDLCSGIHFIQYASDRIHRGPIDSDYMIIWITEHNLVLWNNMRQLLRQEGYVFAFVFVYVCLQNNSKRYGQILTNVLQAWDVSIVVDWILMVIMINMRIEENCSRKLANCEFVSL